MIKLDEIQENLIAEEDRKFGSMQRWHEGYQRGVREALGRVNDAMREEPVETGTPQDKPRTNLDCIRAMSAEELADWISKHVNCDGCPLSGGFGSCAVAASNNPCEKDICNWLNSPAKDVVDG